MATVRPLILTSRDQAEAKRPKHDKLMDVVVHIPVAAAIGISIFGYAQYGWFILGLAPMTLALSLKLSRSLQKIITAWNLRRDVAVGVIVTAGLCFVGEAFGVHLGLARFNEMNAADSLMTFDDAVLIAASIALGVFNVWNRRSYVTGLKSVSVEEVDAAAERNRSWHLKRQQETNHRGWFKSLTGGERKDRQTPNDAPKGSNRAGLGKLSQDDADAIFEKTGAYPFGYGPAQKSATA